MIKMVNNKAVEISNIKLFELAFESIAANRGLKNNIKETIGNDEESIKIADKCIIVYESIVKSLPFPLYALEENIKYAAIGTYIKDCLNEPLNIWIEDGLNIQLKNNKMLKFLGHTWAIKSNDHIKEDNTFIDNYEEDVGYIEFEWVLSKLMNKESLRDFYKENMKDFTRACNNDAMVLKWELSRILEIGYITDFIELKENTITRLDNSSELYIDIYSIGKVKDRKNGEEIILKFGGDFEGINIRDKKVTLHNFDVYEKKTGLDDEYKIDLSRMNKIDLPAALNIFEAIMGRYAVYGDIKKIRYKGVIAQDKLIFQVDNKLYTCNAYEYGNKELILKNVDLYAANNKMIFFKKRILCEHQVIKEITYSYDIKDNSIRVVSIKFKKVEEG